MYFHDIPLILHVSSRTWRFFGSILFFLLKNVNLLSPFDGIQCSFTFFSIICRDGMAERAGVKNYCAIKNIWYFINKWAIQIPLNWANSLNEHRLLHSSSFLCVCAVLQHARTLFWRQGEMWTWNRVFSMSFHTFLRCARSVQIMNHMKIYEGFKRKWNDFYLFRFFTFVISFHFMKQTNA